MALVDLAYSDGGQRRCVTEDLGDRPLFVDSDHPAKRFQLVRAVHGGHVFAARQLDERDRPVGVVAVKILKQLDEGPRDRFINEGRLLSAFRHRSITAYHGSGIHRGQAITASVPWIAMDLCGPNLRQHVLEAGPLRVDLLHHVALQLCEALQYVHEQDVIHRDLKPANIVWAHDGARNGIVKLIDFGIATYTREDVSGRPFHRAAKTSDDPPDHRSDLFQLGKVLWFLATGRLLAGIPSVRHDPTDGPLHRVVSSLIADDSSDRPDSANVIREALRTW